jgi:hypothetical protein
MTTRCAAAPHPAARSELVAFLDLLCADEELLRAEFEDIVAAEWPRPPSRPPSRRAVVHRQYGGNGGLAHRTVCLPGTLRPDGHDTGVDGSGRQRSPPADTAVDE